MYLKILIVFTLLNNKAVQITWTLSLTQSLSLFSSIALPPSVSLENSNNLINHYRMTLSLNWNWRVIPPLLFFLFLVKRVPTLPQLIKACCLKVEIISGLFHYFMSVKIWIKGRLEKDTQSYSDLSTTTWRRSWCVSTINRRGLITSSMWKSLWKVWVSVANT